MHLIRWTHDTPFGFTLRGWHSAPSGKPVLHFIHGNSFCGRVYEPMLSRLGADFDLWLSDVQGHGDSDAGDRFLGWNRSAELAIAAFKAHLPLFGDAPLMAAGHSFGGVLTCLALSAHRELFQRAVVLDPVIFPAAMAWSLTMAETMGLAAQTPLARSARRRRAHWPDRHTAVESLRGRGTYQGWREDALQAFGEHALRPADDGEGVVLKCAPAREAEVFGSGPVGLWSALRLVRTPVCVIHATDTFPFVMPSALQWQGMNHHVSVEQAPGGHCFMQEDPDDAAERVRRFLLQA
jgi:pimeloyl-ACP methyl ester carboxylesterase